MISIESAAEGFVLLADGRRILSHSRRSPCVEIGTAENLIKRGRFSYRLRSRRVANRPLRSFKVLESSDEFASIDFEGQLAMTVRQMDGHVRISFSRYESSINRFRLRLAASPDERIFGCGERFARLDLKGRSAAVWAQARAICRGPGLGCLRALASLSRDSGGDGAATSIPSSAFVSTKDYWCAIDTGAYTTLEFHRGATVADSWAVPREIAFGVEADASRTVSALGAYMGESPAVPDWIFEGAWLEARGGDEETRKRVDAALGAGVKIAALWSRDWHGGLRGGPGPRPVGAYAWDRSLYPGLAGALSSLRSQGIRFVGHASPLLDPKGAAYKEASALGYCVKSPLGGDYIETARGADFAMIDLSSREAAAWAKMAVRSGLLDSGMAGVMADSCEYLPPDALIASAEGAQAYHNRWPMLWARICREAIVDAGLSGAAVVLADSGSRGSRRYADAFWSGDQLSSFSRYDGLAGSVPAALSLGLSGGGLWHTEAGGSISFAWARRGRECLERWIEMSAFSPILRVGDGLRPEASAQVWDDDRSLALLARMSGIYAALKPYHVAAAAELASGGLPPIRHPWVHYESDPQVRKLSYQYLYGRDLMVAPATGGRSSLTELYLPEDEWVHLWTSRSFRGGRVSIESPPGYPAVFYRASSPFSSLFDALRRTARQI